MSERVRDRVKTSARRGQAGPALDSTPLVRSFEVSNRAERSHAEMPDVQQADLLGHHFGRLGIPTVDLVTPPMQSEIQTKLRDADLAVGHDVEESVGTGAPMQLRGAEGALDRPGGRGLGQPLTSGPGGESVIQKLAVDVQPVEVTAVPARSAYDPRKAKPAIRERKVAPSAASVTALGGDWGYTDVENVVPEITVARDRSNNTWRTSLRKLTGEYSLQARLIPGAQEVTGPSGNTTQVNFQQQVDELKDLEGPNWHMLNAVRAHEQVHANSLLGALRTVDTAIESQYTALRVPLTGNNDKNTAMTAVQALPAYAAAATRSKRLWDIEYTKSIEHDHTVRAPAAERKIVDPMIEKIEKHAKARSW